MSITAEDKHKVKNLLNLGKTQGYVTHDDILDSFPEVEENLHLLEYIISSLQDADVELIEPEAQNATFGERASKMTFEEKIAILKQIRSHVSTDPIRAYLQEIGRIPLLSAEEEVILAKRIEEGEEEYEKAINEACEKLPEDMVYQKAKKMLEKGLKKHASIDAAKRKMESKDKRFLNKKIKDGIEATNLLTTANLRLVVSIAKNYLKRGLDLLDLIQEGNLGLMRAVDKFEFRKGFKFSTYATWWIRQAITRAIADQARTIRVPVHMIETINKLSKVSSQLSSKLGRSPTPKEIAKAMGLTIEKVNEIVKIAQKPQSLEAPISDEAEGTSLSDIIPDDFTSSPSELATWSYLKKQITEILATLSDRERKVIELRFGLRDGVARTLEEVGHEFNVTRERIRQIEAKALRRMKSDEIAQALKDYLE